MTMEITAEEMVVAQVEIMVITEVEMEGVQVEIMEVETGVGIAAIAEEELAEGMVVVQAEGMVVEMETATVRVQIRGAEEARVRQVFKEED